MGRARATETMSIYVEFGGDPRIALDETRECAHARLLHLYELCVGP